MPLLAALTAATVTAMLAPPAGAAPVPVAAGAKGAAGTAVASAVLPGANAAAVLSSLTEAQRVGQLIMVGASLGGVSSATRTAITSYHAGSVILTGRSSAGRTAVRSLTSGLQALATTAATGGVPLFMSTDQEGGYVQALSGSGFSTIPTALHQGTLAPATLASDAEVWGGQLAAAGVNLNLAPVLDTVPPDQTSTNQPIGRWDREYGTNPGTVTQAGVAVIRGMHVSGVETAVKHFPGLGRASGNTDTTFGVVDTVTTRHDSYISPYAAGSGPAGAGLVMVSLATYTKIDPSHRAVFSPTVLGGMLRGDLGFTGVIMSDSMDAAAVQDLTPGQRAVAFVAAGGDLVLTTQPTDVPSMTSALLARAGSDAAFRSRVDASCLRVLIAKQRAGLLTGGVGTTASAGRLYLAEQSAGHGVAVRVRTSGTWSAAISLAGNAARVPAVAGIPTGGIEVAEVTPAGAVAVRSYVPGGTSSAWQDLGGVVTSAPGIAVGSPGQVAVVARDTRHALAFREHRPGVGWGSWTYLGGLMTDMAPAVVYAPSGDLNVFGVARGQSIFRNVRHNGRWSGWVSTGGTFESAPAATVSPATGAITLTAEGPHATLWQWGAGAWWHAVPGARPVIAPGAAQTASAATTVVAERLDGRLVIATHTSAGWSAWSVLPFD